MGTLSMKAHMQGVAKPTLNVLAIESPRPSPMLPRCTFLVRLAQSFLVVALAEREIKPLPNISPISHIPLRPVLRSQLALWSLAQRTM
jgi:hypothetical protein